MQSIQISRMNAAFKLDCTENSGIAVRS